MFLHNVTVPYSLPYYLCTYTVDMFLIPILHCHCFPKHVTFLVLYITFAF